MKEVSFGKRFVVFLIMALYSIQLVPCQELSYGVKQGKLRLERYLELADLEREEAKWRELAENGLLMAMSLWESAETDRLESGETKAGVQRSFKKQLEERFVKWKTDFLAAAVL